jgi:hypothetical protein
MDVYVTGQAERELRMLLRLAPQARGLLMGRRLGGRNFVERLLPLPGGFPAEVDDLPESEDSETDVWLGWFSLDSDSAPEEHVLNPAGMGKILLKAAGGVEHPRIHAYLVDYQDQFVLVPVDCHIPTREEPACPKKT